MRPYAERKAARIERLQRRAAGLAADAASTYDSAHRMASVIPFGQPILIGHHSEGRDRRYRDKIHNRFEKSFRMAKESKECARRAEAAESNTMISSDDPEAVTFLRARLAELQDTQRKSREINATIRTAKRHAQKAGVPWEPIAQKAFEDMGIPKDDAERLTKPDFCGRVGIADYKLTNNGANIRRIEQRIEGLTRKAAAPPKEPENFGEVRVEENDNRVQVFFPGKPSAEVRAELKSHGFRWAPSEGAWQRMASHDAWYWARSIAPKWGA